MAEKTFNLYSESDANGGKRSVWLRFTKDGMLILEGQDIGGSSCEFWGSGEYEWAWALPPERISILLESLGLPAPETGDLLPSIGAALNAHERPAIQQIFQAAGATFWSRVGD